MELTTILYIILGLILTIVGGWEIIVRFVMKLNSSDSDLQVSEFQNSNKVKPLLGLKDRLTTYTAIAGLLIFSILFDVFWRDTLGFPFGLLTEISIFLILSIGLILLAARLKKKVTSVRFFIAQEIVFLSLFIIIAAFLSLLVWSVFRFKEHPELFRFETDAGVFSSPAVSDGVVYVGSGDNHLYALDVDGISLKILNKSFIANIAEWDRQFLDTLLITLISIAIWGYGIRIILFLIWVIRDGIRWSFKTMFKE